MEDKRTHLIDNAIGLFIKHGIVSVTMDEVARASGMSKKTVYQHFANKGILVEAVVDLLIEQGEGILRANTNTAIDPVRELFLQQDLFNHLITLRYIFNDLVLQRYPRAHRALHHFKNDIMKKAIEINLKRGIEKALYRHDLDIQTTAGIYNSVTDFFLFNSLRSPGDIFAALHLFINSITTTKGRRIFAGVIASTNR
jgi:AcrR family transcriptional regulator